MSQDTQTTPLPFADLASAYIDLANAQAKGNDAGLITVAVQHAAARYSVHFEASNALDATQFAAVRKVFMEQSLTRYAEYLEHHFDEYIENFARNTGRDK